MRPDQLPCLPGKGWRQIPPLWACTPRPGETFGAGLVRSLVARLPLKVHGKRNAVTGAVQVIPDLRITPVAATAEALPLSDGNVAAFALFGAGLVAPGLFGHSGPPI